MVAAPPSARALAPLIVKICGLSTEATLDAALDAGADMVGFVVYPASPRHVSPQRAAQLGRRVGGRAEMVVLAVDPTDADVAEIGEVGAGWVQLHGRETPDRVAEIRRMTGLRVMKAIGIRGMGDVAAAGPFAAVADRLLFDAKPPIGATLPGGNGVAFNWRLLRGLTVDSPFLLSGGLDPGSVGEAIAIAAPLGVDVSSGVETAPGRKDADLIRAFIAAARLAEARRDIRSVSETMSAGAAG